MGQIGYSSAFAFQSSWNHIELFLPWDPSGFAAFFFDGEWRPGGVYGAGSGRVISLAVWESTYRAFDGSDHGNFEMLALQSHRLVPWHRDNDHPFEWHVHPGIPIHPGTPDSMGFAALALCRTHRAQSGIEGDYSTLSEEFYAIAARRDQGLRIHIRNAMNFTWNNGETMTQLCPTCSEIGGGEEPIPGRYLGLGWVHGTVGDTRVDFHESDLARAAFVATREDGALIFHEGRNLFSQPLRRWLRPQIIWSPQHVGHGAAGRPCIIQSDRGYSHTAIPFDPNRHGNYEVFVPSRTGGIVHFWNDPNGNNPWLSGGAYGRDRYDEVAAVQDRNMRDGDVTGRIHLFGWRRGETSFDHFVQSHRDDGFH